MVKCITIGERTIGEGHPVFIIAEIGYNFNNPDEALASIDLAANSGVDAVKFQTFRAETVTSRFTEFPEEAGGTNQFDEFKHYEMSEEMHQKLFNHARKRGIMAFSTPAYFDDADLLERLDVPVYKIGSDDLVNLPFVRYVAEKGKPVIFATGMATLAECAEALDTIKQAGNEQVVILHCISNYPIEDLGFVNLNVIRAFRNAFNVPVGFSDHTTTPTASLGAVALGASVIERHFTIDKKLDAPDAFFSADPDEMSALVESIRDLEKALGDGVKRPTSTEQDMRLETRKSAIARVDIRKGKVIAQDMIIVKRPGTGIPPRLAYLVPGRRAKQDIAADEVITFDKLE